MKKEFSYYEFTGLLVPGVIFIYFVNYSLEDKLNIQLFNTTYFGEAVFLLIIAYATGHIIQAIGNIFERGIWWLYGGMPTSWLNKPDKANRLFDNEDSAAIKEKIFEQFGQKDKKDHGRNVYNILFINEKTNRVDLFNANYSLFRGLSVAFLMLTAVVLFFYPWKYAIIIFLFSILALRRMIRFAELYARELYRTYLHLE